MGKDIKKIVLTGGPCAGKSTGLSTIEERLSDIGYKILIVPETATSLFGSGVTIGDDGITNFEFQTELLKYQIEKEKIYENLAHLTRNEKVIIVCDRGIIDGKAYCSKEEFDSLCKSLSLKEIKLRDEYDAVFHLKTAADGAEEFYTLENNPSRQEKTPELARKADIKTLNAWIGHPHLRVIGNENNISFDTKINNLMKEILRFLGEPIPIEIQMKFLIEMPDIKFLLEKFNAVKTDIIQTYLKTENKNEEKRIRQRGNNGDYVYFSTMKKTVNGNSRIKREKKISLDEYLNLFMSADTNLKQIKKERYCFVYNNQYFELDIHPFWNDKAILEIKLTEENQNIIIPNFINVIKDVTDDDAFKNYSFAKEIPDLKGDN